MNLEKTSINTWVKLKEGVDPALYRKMGRKIDRLQSFVDKKYVRRPIEAYKRNQEMEVVLALLINERKNMRA